MYFRTIIISVAMTLLFGCTSTAIRPADPDLNASNAATLHLYRVATFVNGGIEYRVFLNEDYIGPLGSGGALIRRVPEGEHQLTFKPYEFGIPSFGERSMKMQFAAGKSYYVRMSSSLENIIPLGNAVSVQTSTSISLVNEAQWKARQ